jgi:ribosomal protein S18 acetylase RimI-like enzyme
MATIWGVGRFDIVAVDPADPRAVEAVSAYYVELDRRFEDGFDHTAGGPPDHDDLRPPRGSFLLATNTSDAHADAAAGCVALTHLEPGVSEIKRMWVAEWARGNRLGARLLEAAEDAACEAGRLTVRLDTNGSLHTAIALYRSHGYVEIEPYNTNPYAQHWFQKSLEP